MNKRILIVFVSVFGLMVAGAGIFAFASETDGASAVTADEPIAVLAQDEAEGPADEPADDKGAWGRSEGPHDRLLDEVLDEMVAEGTLTQELADEIRAAYEAKIKDKVAELPEDFKRFGRKFGPHFDGGWEFDFEIPPRWLEGLDLDEDLLGLFEDGLTPEELEELREQLPEGFEFKFGRRFGPKGPPSDDAEASFGIRIGSFDA